MSTGLEPGFDVWGTAIETFGSKEKAELWMKLPSFVFGWRSPEEFLATGGAEAKDQVITELIHIQHGILS